MNYLSTPGAASNLLSTRVPFNTNTFLNGFEAVPAHGHIILPLVEGGMVDRVVDARAHEIEALVSTVVSEARGLRAGVSPGRWTAHLPYALPATNGEWTMHPMRGRSDVSYDEGVIFRSRSGKHISLWNYRSTIGVGYSGRYAAAYQKVYIDRDGSGEKRVHTSHYFMGFFGLGMQALVRHLGIDMTDMSFSMAYLALRVAKEIYFDGPYSPGQLMDPPGLRADGKDYQLVRSSRGHWTFPQEFTPYNVEFDISLSLEDDAVATTVPAYVKLSRDRLLIDIHRRDDHPEALMPIGEPQEAVWDGACILAADDPDDGEYLARAI